MAGLNCECRRGPLSIDWFRRESGFTTLGAACAILLACSLAFLCAWAGRAYSRAVGVQAVADAAALAAENEVAEFMIAVRAADAVLLSMSLTGLSLVGVGTVCCCVPPAASAGKTMIETGRGILTKRDEVALSAQKMLAALQDGLPAAAQLQAQMVLQENSEELEGGAVGYIELVPQKGEPVSIKGAASVHAAANKAQNESGEIVADAASAQESREKVDQALKKGFLHDCGNAPGFCMYERADELTGLSALENPLYHSVNSWSFSVPLKRAKEYYRYRASHEEPVEGGIEEQARSALRCQFYRYASSELEKGFVKDDGSSAPDLNFPKLPSNTDEMKATMLYTDVAYPVANGNLHAWEGCPDAAGSSSKGSLSEQDEGAYGVCPTCLFDAASLGKVAAASTSIENGFEYHYRKVAQAAEEYEAAAGEAARREHEAKKGVQAVFDELFTAFKDVAACRIEAYPPGRHGALSAIAFDAYGQEGAVFTNVAGDVGSFAAVSAAVMGEDSEQNVLSSLLDGLSNEIGPPLSDAGPAVLSLWGSALEAYSSGSTGLVKGVETLLASVPLVGSAGLGSWASEKLTVLIKDVGLEPANVAAAKPFVSNTSPVAARGDGAVARAIVAAKKEGKGGAS